jgi:acyl-CoA reductase-like NAD-dependent aldehyde dehydrogenase
VLSVHNVRDIDEAIRLVNSGAYGNQACLFTTSGASARKFRYEAEVGNVGINVGVAAPMAYFPSAARARASSAICTARGATRSSSSRRRKSWSSAGPRSGREVLT